MTEKPLTQGDIEALAFLLDLPRSSSAYLRALRARGEEITLKVMAERLREEWPHVPERKP